MMQEGRTDGDIFPNKKSEEAGQGRLLLGYLKQTIKLPPILQADRVNVLKWWVDASYADHEKIWGHTGGTMSEEVGISME